MTDDTSDDDAVGGLVGALARLCETLERLERSADRSTAGGDHVRRGPASIDYNYNISIGTLDSARPGAGRGGGRNTGGAPDRGTSRDAPSFPVEVQQRDDEVLVVADLPNIDRSELSIAVTDGALTLRDGGRVLTQVEVPEETSIASTTINNGVLEVRLDDE